MTAKWNKSTCDPRAGREIPAPFTLPANPRDPFARFLFDSFAEYRREHGSFMESKWIELCTLWHDQWHAARRKRQGLTVSPACHRLYALYPRKIGKNAALKAIGKALEKESEEKLVTAVNRFKFATDRWPREERQFIPHPATWFNEGRFDDDPSEWDRGHSSPRAPAPKFEPIPEPKGWLEWAKANIPEWIRLESGPVPLWDRLRTDEQAMIVKQMPK